ncbi:sugar transferase [Segetibacter sp.]|jgi:lipopolysaccharide/colanic/teichoic acid biosynthesis glycosyltransferase|uniref:sugar transferase n=1 Tax=Segetibacter sp. TaxID=2231182 RepID=UPI00261A7F17|nr:sugar transferase [Segetibacter sp.]MCW3078764.1 wcfS [Segetibacter sp.]
MDLIRCFDFVFSLVGLIILLPFLLLVSLIIKLTSKGPVFFKQCRVGKGGKDFKVYKFRSMQVNADRQGLLTVGGKDARVTRIGYYIRRFKVDELPQLINVLKGEMSIVGPRPEVRRYVDMYSKDQLKALKVLPGITDYASLEYRNENDLLALSHDPEAFYVKEILPRKIELNFKYINNRNILEYFRIIAKTVATSFAGK